MRGLGHVERDLVQVDVRRDVRLDLGEHLAEQHARLVEFRQDAVLDLVALLEAERGSQPQLALVAAGQAASHFVRPGGNPTAVPRSITLLAAGRPVNPADSEWLNQ